MPRKLYGVFLPGERWGLTTRKYAALGLAFAHKGTVRVVNAKDAPVWDTPTFIRCSTVVADYREQVPFEEEN